MADEDSKDELKSILKKAQRQAVAEKKARFKAELRPVWQETVRIVQECYQSDHWDVVQELGIPLKPMQQPATIPDNGQHPAPEPVEADAEK